jgi:hypothetical protein
MTTEQDFYNQTEALAQKWESVNDQAETELFHLGFAPVTRPDFTCPILDPKALTNADLHSYAEMHARFQRWHNYAEYTMARCQSMLVGIKRQISQLESQLKVYYASYKNPETGKVYSLADRKDLVESNPRYVELLVDQTKFEQMKAQMEAQVNGLSKATGLISRHIELRKLDIEQDRVNNNMPGRGMYPQSQYPQYPQR